MSEHFAPGKARIISASSDKQALKRDTKALIRAAGGVEASASYCRTGKSAMGDYQNRNVDSYMPIDVVADLEAVTHDTAGWPIITRRLATMAGGAFVELPEADAMDIGWLSQIGQLAADHGKLSARLCEAAADNTVTPKEVDDLELIAVCDDAIMHLVNLRARFERIAKEGRR
jgi:hypothetical protein